MTQRFYLSRKRLRNLRHQTQHRLSRRYRLCPRSTRPWLLHNLLHFLLLIFTLCPARSRLFERRGIQFGRVVEFVCSRRAGAFAGVGCGCGGGGSVGVVWVEEGDLLFEDHWNERTWLELEAKKKKLVSSQKKSHEQPRKVSVRV